MIRKTILFLMATIFIFASPHHLRGAQQQQEPDSQHRPPADDPIRELNLSPEQREQIRAIRQQLQAERAVINQRLRETNEALEEALDADDPDQRLVEERLRESAAAQAAVVRMRVMSEVKIRRVLTPEQLITLRTLRQRARSIRRERQMENVETRRQQRVERRQGLQNPRNSLGPLLPRGTVPPQKTRP